VAADSWEKRVPHHQCASSNFKEAIDTTHAFLDGELPPSPLADDIIPPFRIAAETDRYRQMAFG